MTGRAIAARTKDGVMNLQVASETAKAWQWQRWSLGWQVAL
jgi:hypothetical protein